METQERQRVRACLDELKPYLSAYVSQSIRLPRGGADGDIAALLRLLLVNWDGTFEAQLPKVARSWIHELIDVRNRWAHEAAFSDAELERALDTMRQISLAIGAPATVPRVPKATPHPERVASTTALPISSNKRPTQRNTMREIYSRNRNSPEHVIQQYAQAERDGLVERKNNASHISSEAYARALLLDGLKKGWLK